MMVMWDPNEDADSFLVEALANGEAPLLCQTSDTFCSFAGVSCGHTYTVHAVSIRDGCESIHSNAVSVSSGTATIFNHLLRGILQASVGAEKK